MRFYVVLDFPDQEFCVPDVDFGYVLYTPNEGDNDLPFNQVAQNYIAVLYFVDHVNEVAYPLYSYSRRNLNKLIDAYGLEDVKNSFKAVIETSRGIMQEARKQAGFYFPELITPWEERERVSKAHYDQRVDSFLSKVIACASQKASRLSETRAHFLWTATVYDPSYAEDLSQSNEFAVFLNGDKKFRYQRAAQRVRSEAKGKGFDPK